jgi:NAD(P) transhydrogenase subunit alpha
MIIAIPKERRPGEARVAASPDTVKKFKALGFDLVVEAGAGLGAAMTDEAYKAAGAAIAPDEAAALKDADVVLKIQRPETSEVALMKSGALLLALMTPHADRAVIEACAKQNVAAVALELIPRITRAQSMDVLSSQANLAGYRAVIDGAAQFTRAFPMMMTAAGTVPAAKVFVMGAGVAGLQAIATARRLGAVVSATDVRRAAGEQVQSLGAKFVMVELKEDMQTAGGYAKELTAEDQARQAELVAGHIKNQDLVITTALIPGRPAPKLVSRAMVESMKPGSVIVDLAVEAGGNCELSKPDEVVRHQGVAIVGYANLPSRIAVDASALFARNLLNFIAPLVDKETKALKIDWNDEIIKASALTRDGQIIHPQLTGKG